MGSLQFRALDGIATNNSYAHDTHVDGLLGLRFWPPTKSTPSIVNVLKDNGSVLSENTAGGEITFGGVDTTRFSGNISFVDCVTDTPWTLPVSSFRVGDTMIQAGGVNASIDTSTTYMLMSETVADALNSAIPGSVKDVSDCN